MRGTGFLQAAFALADRSALHAQLGGYLDTWGVAAIIPELALAREIGEHSLVTLGYRHYVQRGSRFHQDQYATSKPYMSGDPRLDSLVDRAVALDYAWAWENADPDEHDATFTVRAGYTFSAMSRDTLEPAHAIHAGIAVGY